MNILHSLFDITKLSPFYGSDTLPADIKAVKDVTMRSTIEQVPDEQSRTVMRIAAAFARDGKKPFGCDAADAYRPHKGEF